MASGSLDVDGQAEAITEHVSQGHVSQRDVDAGPGAPGRELDDGRDPDPDREHIGFPGPLDRGDDLVDQRAGVVPLGVEHRLGAEPPVVEAGDGDLRAPDVDPDQHAAHADAPFRVWVGYHVAWDPSVKAP